MKPCEPTAANVNAQEQARQGWSSRLARWVTAMLALQAVTGLWMWLGPFSLASQLQVLAHVAAGLLMIPLYGVFQARHLAVWWRQTMTAVMALGYLLMGVVLVCIVSGVVVTWQAANGPKLHTRWDQVHLISGIMAGVLLVTHVGVAYARRRKVADKLPDFRRAVRHFVGGMAGWVGAVIGLVALVSIAAPRRHVELALPDGYELARFSQEFDEYRGSPFAPSYARTAKGTLVDSRVLSGSQSCGTAGCHEQILNEWLPSAHRFAAMNPPFQQVQKHFAADREPAETRYCGGCHDPISLFAGAKAMHQVDLSAPGMQEGVSCVVCHAISQVDERGNADYVLTPPRRYVWEGTDGWRKALSNFLIRAYPRQHLADYDRNILRTGEFCGACHKQFIPEALNRFGMSPGQNQFDEWRRSHWHVDDPVKDLSCRDCHMRLVRGSTDPGRGEAGDVRRRGDDKAHRHHGTIATNFLMPMVLKLPHWQQQVALTEQWIRGETVIEEIAHLWPSGPVASVQIVAPSRAARGEPLTLQTVVTNRKAGHNFTTGPLDFIQSWVHLRVTDGQGRMVTEFGAIDPVTRHVFDLPGQVHQIGNSRSEGTLVLEGMPLDEAGQPLLRHELWRKAGGKGQRVIFPGYSDHQTYRVSVPPDASGPLTVTAQLLFRRYRQQFLDLAVPEMERDSGVYQPSVPQSVDEVVIAIDDAAGDTVSAGSQTTGGEE